MLYDHVIVPFDGSDASRDVAVYAADLARVVGARLLLLTSAEVRGIANLDGLKQRAVEISEQPVDVWVDAQKRPADAVAKSVSYRPGSLVCMATHARTGLRKAVHGSVAEDVIRAVDAPVLLFGPAWTPTEFFDPDRLLVCIDGSRTSEEVLPEAEAWRSVLELECTMVHVDLGDDHSLTHDGEVAQRVARLVEPFVEHGAELSVVPAHAVPDAIVELTLEHPAAVLAMATHSRSGVARLTTGSITMDVVLRSEVPVLVRSAAHAG